MKKRLVAGILSAVMMLSLVACGSKNAGEVKVTLGQYKGIELTNITDEAVMKEIDNTLKQYATLKEVDRVAANGDTVNIDFVGKKDGVAFEGGTAESYDLELGSNSFIDGFESGLVGTKAGQTVDLNLTFPAAYQNADLAGAAVVFTVTVNSVKESVIPELTDDFVKGSFDYATVAEYKQSVYETMNKSALQEQIGKKLMETSTVENIPEEELKGVSDNLYNMYIQYAQMYAQYFGASPEEILASIWGFTSTTELREYTDQYADESVAYSKVIEKIAEVEKIAPTDAQFQERGAQYAVEYGYDDLAALVEQEGEDTVKSAITMDLVLEFIIANAIIK